jgi:carbamoyltransferase
MTTFIIGISCYYHDSAAALILNGEIVSAAQEERFSRKKHDSNFPAEAIKFCLQDSKITLSQVSHIAFYDKPFIKFERLLETYLTYAPRGIKSFLKAMPIWIREKLFLKRVLKVELSKLSGISRRSLPPLLFAEHHQSHAASAFFASPFHSSAVLCADGVGEWATTTLWRGGGNELVPLYEINFPHSLGLLYSAFTYYTGFRVNSGEYKLMGLAPYGEAVYKSVIYEHLIDVKSDGSFMLDMSYFDYPTGLRMTSNKFHELFGGPPRKPESEIAQREMNLASSIQQVIEETLLKIAKTLRDKSGESNLCLAGGVALNSVANGVLEKSGIFENIWVQPASGDAGGAVGSALAVWYQHLKNPRIETPAKPSVRIPDSMKGSYLGPSFDNQTIRDFLERIGADYQQYEFEQLTSHGAELISQGNVIGWFQGRMEFGPRALGNRSIIGDARNRDMQSKMNLKIKYRESFRPFAPSVLFEKSSEWFDLSAPSPYMLTVTSVNPEHCISMDEEQSGCTGIDKINVVRSTIPAVTHVDYSARVQTVHKETNSLYWELLNKFEKLTGCPVIINTSFNVRGEPIVCTPEDAYRCFKRSEMDYLVLGNCIIDRSKQNFSDSDQSWEVEYPLD